MGDKALSSPPKAGCLGQSWRANPGHFSRVPKDTPFFVDSRASRLVQLADHVAYSVFRRYNSGDAQYMDIIASRFDEADGVIHGLCHKHNERVTCMCPGCLSRRLKER
jgi:uncharacterized protein DUF3800